MMIIMKLAVYMTNEPDWRNGNKNHDKQLCRINNSESINT